jgi:hypothetical protein
MSNLVQSNMVEKALIEGDLSGLTPDQRLSHYKAVCESVGLNPLTKPFEYIKLNGKLVLYAKRDATDQLRKINKVSVKIQEVKTLDGVYVVVAEAKDKDGREDSSTGAVSIKGLTGDALANAFMKAETKAKRRVTLSICGLGILDESEVETIKDAKPFVENEKPQLSQNIANPPRQESPEDPEDYVVQFGKKFAGIEMRDIPTFEIEGYIKYLKEGSAKNGKELTGHALDFVTYGEAVIHQRNNQGPEPKFNEEEIPF